MFDARFLAVLAHIDANLAVELHVLAQLVADRLPMAERGSGPIAFRRAPGEFCRAPHGPQEYDSDAKNH